MWTRCFAGAFIKISGYAPLISTLPKKLMVECFELPLAKCKGEIRSQDSAVSMERKPPGFSGPDLKAHQ